MRYKVLLIGSCCLASISVSSQAADYTVNSAVTSRNGGSTINGDDTLTATTSGSITISSDHGIKTTGNGNTVIVHGSIEASANQRQGIRNLGSDNTTTLNGSITTSGSGGHGISNSGDNNTTVVNGTITTSGTNGDGILSKDTNSTTTVNGTITTSGTSANGIYQQDADGSTLTVNGTIATTGAAGHVVHIGSDNTTASINGTLQGAVSGVVTVHVFGAGNTVNVSGTLDASSGSGSAINNNDGINTYNIQEGAVLKGRLVSNGDYLPILNFDQEVDKSYAYTTEGNWTVNFSGGRPFAYSDNVAVALTTENSETADEMLFARTRSLHDSLQRNSGAKQSAWADVYNHASERASNPAEPTMKAYRANSNGISIGEPLVFGGQAVDIIFNRQRTNLRIGSDSQTLNNQSVKLGLMLKELAPAKGLRLAASGFIGRNTYDGVRSNVVGNLSETGITTLSSHYSTTDMTLGLAADYKTQLSKTFLFEGAVEGAYVKEHFAAYAEGDAITWNARQISQSSGGLSVGLVYQPQKSLSYHLRVGAQSRTVNQGAEASYSVGSSTVSTSQSVRSEVYYDAEIGAVYQNDNGLNFSASLGGFRSDYKVTGKTAHFRMNWVF